MKIAPEKSVAAIVAIALIGLISVQVYWARLTYKETEAVYNDKMIKLLSNVRDDLNDAATCFVLYSKTYINSHEGFYIMKSNWKGKDELWDKNTPPDSIPMFFNVPEEYKSSPLHRVYNDIKFSNPVTAEILLKFRYDLNNSSPDKKILSQKFSTDNFKDLIKNHENLLNIYDTLMIDSLIRFQLISNNMPTKYYYALVKTQNDSIIYSSNRAVTQKILSNGIRTRLTPADMFSYPYDIIFYSENKPEYIYSQIIRVLSISIGIIILLLFAYLYFIRTILKQKKLSEMKNDFINNITHEFNTPISNISLAYETLREKEKITRDAYSDRVVGIIQTETNRLKDNVIRILKISSFERNGVSLLHEQMDLSELISAAIERYELKINQKNAIINFNKPDDKILFTGDRLQLLSAIENLIDNGLKYSNENCRIDIELMKSGSEIIIRFKDNGIGINANEMDKIFEKFYRVQHGNIQNDRGFGLGLNYVKYVIEAHGGKITVNSRKGTGSCFQIILTEDESKN